MIIIDPNPELGVHMGNIMHGPKINIIYSDFFHWIWITISWLVFKNINEKIIACLIIPPHEKIVKLRL